MAEQDSSEDARDPNAKAAGSGTVDEKKNAEKDGTSAHQDGAAAAPTSSESRPTRPPADE